MVFFNFCKKIYRRSLKNRYVKNNNNKSKEGPRIKRVKEVLQSNRVPLKVLTTHKNPFSAA